MSELTLKCTPMHAWIKKKSERDAVDFQGENSWSRQEQSTAAAAKSLQSCPTLCNPIDGSPPGSPVPGILQAKILEQVAISFSNA